MESLGETDIMSKWQQLVSDSKCDDVNYLWSTKTYTIKDILNRFRLPCVVQYSNDNGRIIWDTFYFKMRQPLLLCAVRQERKVHARSMIATPDVYKGTKHTSEMLPKTQLSFFGPPLVIPEDYDGNFAIRRILCLSWYH